MRYDTYNPPKPGGHLKTREVTINSGISRLMSAAIVSRRFRDLLLKNPDQALSEGYLGEIFELSVNEKKLILSIQADTIQEFALQLSGEADRQEIAPIQVNPYRKIPVMHMETD